MDITFQQHIPAQFNDNSKVWIYQSNRIFSIAEALQLEPMLQNFIKQWAAHGDKVYGYANLFFGQFIIIMADESHTIVSGCSGDSLFRFIKQIEQQFNVSLLDRQLLAFILKEKIQVLPFSQVKYALENNFINGDTLFFNNLVATKKELLNNWITPAKNSWLNKSLKFGEG